MPIITDRPAVTTATGPFRRDPRTLRNMPPLRSVPGKVRLVKDLLRVGKWPVGLDPVSGNVEFWDVTPATLESIQTVFRFQKQSGQTRPLQWGHADLSTGSINVAAEKVVDYWDDVFTEAGTLWGVIYVIESTAKTLTDVNRPVSVGVDHRGVILTPGRDTAPMKNALIHVALVDQGAMPGQGPFVQMAAPRSKAPATRPKSAPRQQASVTPAPEPTRRERILAIRDRYQRRHG